MVICAPRDALSCLPEFLFFSIIGSDEFDSPANLTITFWDCKPLSYLSSPALGEVGLGKRSLSYQLLFPSLTCISFLDRNHRILT